MARRALLIHDVPEATAHPAVLAWREAGGPPPARLQALKQASGVSVFRLWGAGPSGTDVVAKWRSGDGVIVEQRVYEEVLPAFGLRALRCYGSLPGDGGRWLFVEHAGEAAWAPERDDHLTLAGRWLAVVHAAGEPACEGLPARGPDHHRETLHEAAASLARVAGRGHLGGDDAVVVGAVRAQLEAIERRWPEVEDACAAVPPALVHGDFVAKNLRVCDGALLCFDWELAETGFPLIDVASLASTSPAALRAYRPNGVEPERLVAVGLVLRVVAAVAWTAIGLNSAWPLRSRRHLGPLHAMLDDATRQAGW
jgi:Phosphotransferase enzyme family